MVGPFDCNYLKNRELSNDDDDGIENVAKKLNLPHFKCYRVYLELLYNLSNVTLHRIVMLKVKARARHAFTLRQKNLF